MSWDSHSTVFMAWGYAFTGFAVAYYFRRQQKAQKEDEFIAYYRYSGTYAHPWEREGEGTLGLQAVKGTDYTKMIVKPQGVMFAG